MIERKLNSGRSILEMLGVLAIIAVITLMGLGLIRFLINYAEAYSTIKSVNETAMELRIRQGRGYLVENYWMFKANIITTQEGQRVLTLTMRDTASEGLCKAILRQAKRNTEIIKVEVEPANCTADNNQVVFYFAFDEGTYHSPFTGDANTDKNDPLSGVCAGKSIQNGACTYDDGDCILRKDVGDSCGSGSICLPDGTDLVCRECPEELPDGYCRAWDGCDGLVDKADGDSCGENSECQSGECVCTLVCQNGGNIVGDCQSCACVGHWGGEDCSTCAENWRGDDCQTCGLPETDCTIKGKVLNSDTCSCECLGNWAGENCDDCNLSISQCGTTQAIDENNCLCVCDNNNWTGYNCDYACPAEGESSYFLSKDACLACPDTSWNWGQCAHCTYLVEYAALYSTLEDAEKYCISRCEDYGAYVPPEQRLYPENGVECRVPSQDSSCPTDPHEIVSMPREACLACELSTIWSDGYCYGCGAIADNWTVYHIETKEEAEVCDNACSEYGLLSWFNTYYDSWVCQVSETSDCSTILDYGYVYGISKTDCEACGDNFFWYGDGGGNCYDCNTEEELWMTKEEAIDCVDRCADAGVSRQWCKQDEDFYVCRPAQETSCPGGNSVECGLSETECAACGNTFWVDNTCYGCGYSYVIYLDTETEATNCANVCAGSSRIAEGTKCYPNTICPSATSLKYNMSKSACEACGNTVWKDGTCYGCGYSSDISYATAMEARACVTACAGSGYERYQSGTTCSLATSTTCPTPDSVTSKMSKSDCEACGNAFWKGETCYGCGYSSGISFSTEAEAEACMNTCAGSGYERYQSGKYCYLATGTTCPTPDSVTSKMSKSTCEACDNAFWLYGDCYDCGYSSMVDYRTETDAKACMNACAGTEYERYQAGLYCYPAINTACPSADSYVYDMSKSVCEACVEEDGVQRKWVSGICYSCGTSDDLYFGEDAEAQECVDLCADSGYERYRSGSYCYLATNTTCPSENSTEYSMSKSVCEACGDTLYNEYAGACYDCGYLGDLYFNTEKEAKACVNACAGKRYQRGMSCYLATNTACPTVSSPQTTEVSKSDCEACGNTFWNNGTCYSCGYSSGFSFGTEAEAEACMNMCAGSEYERYQSGKYCYLATNTTCPSENSMKYRMSKSDCEACGNTIWKDGGDCYSCGYLSTSIISKVSKPVCEACGNTVWNNGVCYGCGYSSHIDFATEAEAKECENTCSNRIADGNVCYEKKGDCPVYTDSIYDMAPSECEQCDNAFADSNGYCNGCGYPGYGYFETYAEAKACEDACKNSPNPRTVDMYDGSYFCAFR